MRRLEGNENLGRITGELLGRKSWLSGQAGPDTHLVRSKILFLSFGTPLSDTIERSDTYAKLLGYGPPTGTLAAELCDCCGIYSL